ncbi:MAG: glycosyltransferase [Lachnospiraceae bacterium]|nr:glycosyltransferase [Lachnospiraceae bacterium]
MRILVNDIAASKTGALSILKDFHAYLQEHADDNEWIFLLSDHYLEETGNIRVQILPQVKKGWLHRLAFDLFYGKKVVREYDPDVYFSMQNTLPFGYRGKQALYVHQPLGFQKTKRFSLLLKREREYAVYQHLIGKLINASVRKADLTIVQTEWMKKALTEVAHADPAKVQKVLPTMPDLSAYAQSVQPDTHTFFYPSGSMLYKNHSLLYEAAGLLYEKGYRDFKIRLTLTKEELSDVLGTGRDRIPDCFDCMGRIDRERVYELYQRSVLLFPSYIETFGYPPAEASAIGTIVLASDCPFCHEVLDGYPNARFFDPFDAAALAGSMEAVMKGEIRCLKTEQTAGNTANSWAEVVELVTGL